MCKKVFLKHSLIFAAVTAFVAAFSAIYEYFGRGVNSTFMIFAFTVPLAAGVLGCLLLSLPGSAARLSYGRRKKTLARSSAESLVRAGANVYYTGIAALTMGMVVQGALDIYGTTNALVKGYWFGGAALTVTGLVLLLTAYGIGPSEPAGAR